jgi:hypothetical protein
MQVQIDLSDPAVRYKFVSNLKTKFHENPHMSVKYESILRDIVSATAIGDILVLDREDIVCIASFFEFGLIKRDVQ